MNENHKSRKYDKLNITGRVLVAKLHNDILSSTCIKTPVLHPIVKKKHTILPTFEFWQSAAILYIFIFKNVPPFYADVFNYIEKKNHVILCFWFKEYNVWYYANSWWYTSKSNRSGCSLPYRRPWLHPGVWS